MNNSETLIRLKKSSTRKDQFGYLMNIEQIREENMKKLRSGLLLILFVLSACSQQNQEQGPAGQTLPTEAIGESIDASGTVVPAVWANASFTVGGSNLRLEAEAGQLVRKGQIIASVNPRNAELAVASAEAQLASANATLEQAEESDFASDQEIDIARQGVKIAEIGLEQAQLNLVNTELYAPIEGTVIDVYANPGENVSPGAPVFLIADLNSLQVQTSDLNEIDVARIKVGDKASVFFDAFPETVVNGTISEIALKNANVPGVYYTISIELEEIPAGLYWGMSAFVQIDRDQ